MKLLSIVWDFDPTLLNIGGFEIRWYSLTWVAALLFGGWLFAYFCKREGKPSDVSDRAFMYIALGTIIGARLGHCLFYDPVHFLSHPWEIITGIRDGGLASHGAAIGIVLGIWLSSRKSNVSVWWTADRLGIIAPMSGAMIRFGNLFNSEIYGHATELPWGFKFVRNYKGWAIENIPACHPTQIYEALCYIICFVVLFLLYRNTKIAQRKGFIFGAAMVGIFLSRFIIEFVKNNQEEFEENMMLNMGQWLSVPFVLCGVAIMIWAWFCHKDEPTAATPTATNKVKTQKNKRHFKK
jgi:prolipoprotein diacylglyceryl transferase